MADYTYPILTYGLARGTIDLTGKLKVMLVGSKYQPSAKHKTRDDVTHEVKGNGYESGGTVLTGNTVELIKDATVLKAPPTIWNRVTVTAGGAVVYHSSGGGAKYDELIGYWKFDSERSAINGELKLNWSEDGLIELFVSNSNSG